MYDMDNYIYSWSGAAIGDASAYDYALSGGYTQTLSHPDGDIFTADATSGNVDGIQLYRVDSSPLRSGAINSSSYTNIDTLRYWGVKIIGTGSTTYDITYDYLGLPGIPTGSDLNLAYRDNLSDNSWEDLGAFWDQGAHTLTKTGLNGTEFALAYTEINSINVMLKVFLEGPYNGSSMNTALNTFLPTSQPYSGAPWNYSGSENVTSVPSGVVDWVLVELRSNPTTVESTRAAFLKNDGTIVDIDGVSPLAFNVSDGNYYIVIMHRNHLAIMSLLPQSFTTGNVTSYDFTTAQTQAYGTNPMKNLGSGKFGMVAGDGNKDGGIYAQDYTLYQTSQGNEGYLFGDYNLDGGIYAQDYTIYQLNQGLETYVP